MTEEEQFPLNTLINSQYNHLEEFQNDHIFFFFLRNIYIYIYIFLHVLYVNVEHTLTHIMKDLSSW